MKDSIYLAVIALDENKVLKLVKKKIKENFSSRNCGRNPQGGGKDGRSYMNRENIILPT